MSKIQNRATNKPRKYKTSNTAININGAVNKTKRNKQFKKKAKSFKSDVKEMKKKNANKKTAASIATESCFKNNVKLSSNWQAFLQETKEKESHESKSRSEYSGVVENGKWNSSKKSSGREHEKRKTKREKGNGAKKRKTEVTIDEKDIWFDDVDVEDIEHATGKKIKKLDTLHKNPLSSNTVLSNSNENSTTRETKYVALDCEMVGVGIDGKDSMLARVSLVNSFGEEIYDKFVAPMQKVVDYRTEFSGVRPDDLKGAPDFKQVQVEVAALTKGKVLVGHSINNDLKVLLLSHPRKHIRDAANYKPFKKMLKTRFPSLKKLTKEILQVDIQSGEHSSVEDARCTMKIFQLHRKQWEKSLKEKGHKSTVDNVPKIFMGKKDAENARNFRKRKINERRKMKKNS